MVQVEKSPRPESSSAREGALGSQRRLKTEEDGGAHFPGRVGAGEHRSTLHLLEL